MWEFSEGIDGIKEASLALKLPVVSGNVSFYNQTDKQAIKPSPMLGLVGRHKEVRQAFRACPQNPGVLYLLSPDKTDLRTDFLREHFEFEDEIQAEKKSKENKTFEKYCSGIEPLKRAFVTIIR